MNRHEKRQKEKISKKNTISTPDILNLMKTAYQYQMSDNFSAAEEIYTTVLGIDPEYPEALCMLGMAKNGLGQDLESCLYSINKAIAISPKNHLYHFNKGLVLQSNGALEEAIASFTECSKLAPNYIESYIWLGKIYTFLKNFDKVKEALDQVLLRSPNHFNVCDHLAFLCTQAGKIDDAIVYFKRALRKNQNPKTHSNLLYTLNYDPSQTDESFLTAHKEWNKHYGEPLAGKILPHSNEPTPDKILKIGYVSADFKCHPVADFLLPSLGYRSKNIKIYCYSSGPKEDSMTKTIKRFSDSWCSIVDLSDEEAAKKIRADGIDILVDLAGHTAGNRLGIFARKPAPIQASWIGYFNTTGVSTMDYFISDNTHLPPGYEKGFTEEIVRLPDCYIAYAPRFSMFESREFIPSPTNKKFAGHDIEYMKYIFLNLWDDFIDKIRQRFPVLRIKSPNTVNVTPAVKAKYITFASFNNIAKLNSGVMELWAEILHKVPNSRLILKTSALDDSSIYNNVIQRFAALNIGKERLELQGWSSLNDLYRLYNKVDIALDPFPFTGGATTCDALWMGAPVITLAGDSAVSRQGATYLTTIGLTELIAHTKEEYVTLAITLSNDLGRLTTIRSGLRERMLRSPLCNAKRFAENLEHAYRQMWQKWCAKSL